MLTLLSNEFLEFPAKTVQSSDRKQCQLGISVLQHGCLTGEVLKCLLDTISLPRKNEVLPFSLVILAILHDIGKVNPEFLRRLINNLSLEYKNGFPRVCGDVSRPFSTGRFMLKLSPRMRGCFLSLLQILFLNLAFPAYAGMFLGLRPALRRSSSFPRVCGDVSALKGIALDGSKLSPRMRGCFSQSV